MSAMDGWERETVPNSTDVQLLQQRLVMLEGTLLRLQTEFTNSQQDDKSFREDVATKETMRLELRNLQLEISNLKLQFNELVQRLEKLETNIVTKVEAIAKTQQESATTSLKRIVAVQATVLVMVLGAVFAVLAPVIFNR